MMSVKKEADRERPTSAPESCDAITAASSEYDVSIGKGQEYFTPEKIREIASQEVHETVPNILPGFDLHVTNLAAVVAHEKPKPELIDGAYRTVAYIRPAVADLPGLICYNFIWYKWLREALGDDGVTNEMVKAVSKLHNEYKKDGQFHLLSV